jgi:hypothetical protein
MSTHVASGLDGQANWSLTTLRLASSLDASGVPSSEVVTMSSNGEVE